MICPTRGRVLFYPVVLIPGSGAVVRNGRSSPFQWRAPCDTAGQARDVVDREIDHNGAMIGFVVSFPERNAGPEILGNYIRPESSRKLIKHYLDLCDLIDKEHPP